MYVCMYVIYVHEDKIEQISFAHFSGGVCGVIGHCVNNANKSLTPSKTGNWPNEEETCIQTNKTSCNNILSDRYGMKVLYVISSLHLYLTVWVG